MNFSGTCHVRVILIMICCWEFKEVNGNKATLDVTHVLQTFVKDAAGQVAMIADIGAPDLYLKKYFGTWETDQKSYMIPPTFRAKHGLYHGFGHYSDTSDLAENIIFKLLKQLVNEYVGMIVIHGFHLPRLEEVCIFNTYPQAENHSELEILTSDYIVFHHSLGVIFMEVSHESKIRDSSILLAERQLENTQYIIEKFSSFNSSNRVSVPQRRVVVMPYMKKSHFNHNDVPSLKNDTLLLFADDAENYISFEKWWGGIASIVKMIPRQVEAYKKALSYTLMIRHLGPLTKPDCLVYLRQGLSDVQDTENIFSSFSRWIIDIMDKIENGFDFGGESVHSSIRELNGLLGEANSFGGNVMALLNKILEKKLYLIGSNPSGLDRTMATYIGSKVFFSFTDFLRFINSMRQNVLFQGKPLEETEESVIQSCPFLKLESLRDLNDLGQHLSKFTFLGGNEPTLLDKRLFESLTCNLRFKHSRLPIIMTSQQLEIFEGPKNQLIIGSPGSGKTELLKFKALQLEAHIKSCEKEQSQKILYIVSTGSLSGKPLLSYQIEDFFEMSTLVEVMTIIIEEENEEALTYTKLELKDKMNSGEYSHVFIDEYWIGSKPLEHEIIVELVNEMPGYVWISSVFDYHPHLINTNERVQNCTKLLLDTLEKVGGKVSYITQVLRTTNSIINLMRKYNHLYSKRKYPYGTQTVLDHSFEGLPITWIKKDTFDEMYTACVTTVHTALTKLISINYQQIENLILNPADILIVDFSVRSKESLRVLIPLEQGLQNKGIPFWTFEEDNRKQFMNCTNGGKVTLCNSYTRKVSTYLDGVEWPMVVVILPHGVLLNEMEKREGAEKLRNYDPYISLFRSMAKLIVISDKWENNEDFLQDIKNKLNS